MNFMFNARGKFMGFGTRSAQRLAALLAAEICLTLAGCGGGDAADVSPQAKNVVLTRENALAAARATDDFFDLFELDEFVNEFIEGRNTAWYSAAAEHACIAGDANSGTMLLVAPGVTAVPRVGDLITVTYKNCMQDASVGDRLSGTLSIQLTAVTGNPALVALHTAWAYSANVNFTKLEIKSVHRHHIIDGNMTIQNSVRGVANSLYHDIYDLRIASDRVHIQKDADLHEFTNVSMAVTQDASVTGPGFQATVNGSIESTVLGGKLDVQTTKTFSAINEKTEYPTAGTARLIGGQGSSIDLRPQSGGTVLLDLRTTADAAVVTINSNWSEIDHD